MRKDEDFDSEVEAATDSEPMVLPKYLHGKYDWNIGEDVAPEKVTQIFVLADVRTGSSFLHDLIKSHPGVFSFFEPLMNKKVDKALLASALECRYPNLPYIMNNFPKFVEKSDRWWNLCAGVYNKGQACGIKSFNWAFCKKFPFRMAKVVRASAGDTENLLKYAEIGSNIRVIQLVRDPRASLASKLERNWCQGNCNDPFASCQIFNKSVVDTIHLSKKYPTQYMLVRFEDLVVNTDNEVKRLFNFLGLDPQHIFLKEFIATHMHGIHDGSDTTLTTYKNSNDVLCHWPRSKYTEKIQEIQNYCQEPMRAIGYEVVENLRDSRACKYGKNNEKHA